MTGLEYLLTKCGLELDFPNCPGHGKCSTCDNKKRIEYNLDRYKAREKEGINYYKFHVIL